MFVPHVPFYQTLLHPACLEDNEGLPSFPVKFSGVRVPPSLESSEPFSLFILLNILIKEPHLKPPASPLKPSQLTVSSKISLLL